MQIAPSSKVSLGGCSPNSFALAALQNLANPEELCVVRSISLARIFSVSILLFATGGFLRAQEESPHTGPKHHMKYKLIDLGTFGGPDSSIPFEQRILTKHGTVVGIAETDIPDPFAPNCSSPNCKVQNGFEWSRGKMIQLPRLSANGETGAQAINDRGRIVGEAQNGLVDPKSGVPEINAVLWDDLEIVNLGTLGGNSSGALSVSNRGYVVGWSDTNVIDPASGGTETHAFLWKDGVMHDLGTLGGPLSFGQDVNDRGQVCGYSFTNSIPNQSTGNPAQHPFLWQNGAMRDLSLGGTDGGCSFINARGQVHADRLLVSQRFPGI
jgi:probable HAF family extracellular repeat protein